MDRRAVPGAKYIVGVILESFIATALLIAIQFHAR